MKHKWKCEECVKHGTDACYNGGRYDHDDCKYMLIDVDYAYNQALEDMLKGLKEILEDNAIYNIDCVDTLVKQLTR